MLKEHMRVHDNIREYLCAECGKGELREGRWSDRGAARPTGPLELGHLLNTKTRSVSMRLRREISPKAGRQDEIRHKENALNVGK